MLFRRREPEARSDQIRLWLWPRVSWRRSVSYFQKRVVRLSGSPHGIAIGAAVGAAVSFTPFLGFHLIIAFVIAWVLRGNLLAAAIGTCAGNPLTFPFIWAASYELGRFLLGQEAGGIPVSTHHLMGLSLDQLLPILKPLIVGSLPLGIVMGLIVYFIVARAVTLYQGERRERITRGRAVQALDEHAAINGGRQT